ncbi:MAG: hypothetical protein LBL37_01850, partial [Gracilibacteraceae bacterium]|nr:hypothetical protein [Gracilibacteraceae bacterium]
MQKLPIAIAMTLALTASCAPTPTPAPGGPVPAAVFRDEPAAAAPLIAPAEESEAAALVAAGANDFAFRLSAALARQAEGENLICSPFSVWLPLAALANATDASHRDALMAALSAAGAGADDVNAAASRLLYSLTKEEAREYAEEDYPDPLRIANAIFVAGDVTLKKDFAQTFMDHYRGSVAGVDFTAPEAVEAVNRWAAEGTQGLITEIIQEFDPDTVAALASAIYFSDRWSAEFDPALTAEGVFHAPGEDTTAFYMMRDADLPYYEDDLIQALPLRFVTGGALYVLLPKDGDATGLLASMTEEYFKKIQENSTFATGTLLLPRFSLTSGAIGLKDTLTALGVPLFDRVAAPLTGGLIEENIPVFLSDAV